MSSAASAQDGHSGKPKDEDVLKQQLRQKKMEERRLKQQAAREKRAASGSVKPGLGAVKRD